MKYTIYARSEPVCPFCEAAKKLAYVELLDHKVVDIGKDITAGQFLEMFPDQRTIPLIMAEDDNGNVVRVGGYEDLKRRLELMKTTVEIKL